MNLYSFLEKETEQQFETLRSLREREDGGFTRILRHTATGRKFVLQGFRGDIQAVRGGAAGQLLSSYLQRSLHLSDLNGELSPAGTVL